MTDEKDLPWADVEKELQMDYAEICKIMVDFWTSEPVISLSDRQCAMLNNDMLAGTLKTLLNQTDKENTMQFIEMVISEEMAVKYEH